MKRKLTILMGFLLTVLISTGAYAYGGEGRGHGGWMDGNGKKCMQAGFKKLNLTAEQKTKIDALEGECKKEVQPLREEMMTKRAELRALWLENSPDTEKIKAAQKEMSILRDQMIDKMTTFRLSALALLTPEQKAEAHKFYKGKGSEKYKEGKVKNTNKVKASDNK